MNTAIYNVSGKEKGKITMRTTNRIIKTEKSLLKLIGFRVNESKYNEIYEYCKINNISWSELLRRGITSITNIEF